MKSAIYLRRRSLVVEKRVGKSTLSHLPARDRACGAKCGSIPSSNRLVGALLAAASPKLDFNDGTFDRSAASFDNPDDGAIVIHNYRWRFGLAEGETKYYELEKRLVESPVITVPAITLEGDANGAPHPDPGSYAKKFSGKSAHRTINSGVGHNLPREAPDAFAKAIGDIDAFDQR